MGDLPVDCMRLDAIDIGGREDRNCEVGAGSQSRPWTSLCCGARTFVYLEMERALSAILYCSTLSEPVCVSAMGLRRVLKTHAVEEILSIF